MSFIIDQSITIEAPVALVWETITDLACYGEWNPFVVECESSLSVDDPIVMRVQIFESFAQAQTEIIKSHTPGEHLCYGLPPQPLGALESIRCHDVKRVSDLVTAYRSSFELKGWLSPIVEGMLGGRLRAGFGAMTEALGARAEALRAERARG